MKDVTLVIPVYNESECIEKVISSWHAYLTSLNLSFGLILLNDGSKDNTKEVLEKIKNKYSGLTVIHKENSGHGNTILQGYNLAVKEDTAWIFQVDSDDQFFPEDFKLLWDKRNESDFILGQRLHRQDAFHRLVITRIVRLITVLLFGVYSKDTNIPFRLIKKSYMSELLKRFSPDVFAPNIFLSVLAIRDRQPVFHIPVKHKDRETGQVSIIRWKLLKICFRCVKELLIFRLFW